MDEDTVRGSTEKFYRRGKAWTPDEDNALISYIEEHKSTELTVCMEEVSKILNRTIRSVYARYYVLNRLHKQVSVPETALDRIDFNKGRLVLNIIDINIENNKLIITFKY